MTKEQAELDMRGIFYTNYPRKILFSKKVILRTAKLPRWKPTGGTDHVQTSPRTNNQF
jgi:hypothetical protein